jgi:SAM-dependent methyltransferase
VFTFRRSLLDQHLKNSTPKMKGAVLDIGGTKINKRGSFRPPLGIVDSWTYLNSDSGTQPDLCCSAQSIPLNDGSVDTIVCCEVMEYLETPEQVMAEIFRVLRTNGTALITIPFLYPVHGDYWVDRHRWTLSGYQELCHRSGFKNIKIQEMGSLGAVLWDLFHVSLGYGCQNSHSTLNRILRKLLQLTTPLFKYLDQCCSTQKKYITTGYFIELHK